MIRTLEKQSQRRIGALREAPRSAALPSWLETLASIPSQAQAEAIPEPEITPAEAKGIAPADIPDRSVWRSVVATWGIPMRQKWADLAEANQVAGDPWNVAEWKAYLEVTP